MICREKNVEFLQNLFFFFLKRNKTFELDLDVTQEFVFNTNKKIDSLSK